MQVFIIKYTRVVRIYTEDPQRDLDIYIDIVERAGQHANVERIKMVFKDA